MIKRFRAVTLLMLFCLMCGCAGREAQEKVSDESSLSAESPKENTSSSEESKEPASGTKASKETGADMESETKKAEESETSGEGDEIWFIGEKANAGFHFTADEYDYAFNFRGFYLSYDGKQDQIYIDPIEFVWSSETERWLEFGFSLDDPGTHASRNVKEELISIPLAEDVEFHICNARDIPIMKELSDRYNEVEWVTTRPEVFLYYTKSFSSPLTNWPFFMILDEEGNVKYVVENLLIG